MERTSRDGCRQLVTVCADLKENESAIIISDPATKEIGAELTNVALSVTNQVDHVVIPSAEIHGKEPPSDVAARMAEYDVIFGITKMSMAHTQARYQATMRGSRYLSLPDYSPELLKREALFVDFREITTFSQYLADRFTQGDRILIKSKLGTDLKLNIKGRVGNAAPGWCYAPGVLASPPDAEANVPPVENETEGVFIVDGSIPCRELGILTEPVTFTIKSGKIVNISGRDADRINTIFDRLQTDATRVAAEFGIGLNPSAQLIGSMLEDEGCLGTIHIGFGSNITIGGTNKVPFHLDTIMRDADIYIDDELIMKNGSLDAFKYKTFAA